MCFLQQKNDSTTIERSIRQHDWMQLESILSSAQGYIGDFGGRYCSHTYSLTEGPAYLDDIFWAVFREGTVDASRYQSEEQVQIAERVLIQLRRIYNQTQAELERSSWVANIITGFYDFKNQTCADGYPSGIDRLEDAHGSDYYTM